MTLTHRAPSPISGSYEPGFERLVEVFAQSVARGDEIGASVSVYQHGRPVVDLWGGLADVASRTPWERHTRLVVFSVTKGLTAMALHLLVDRGQLDLDAKVADYWPGFARNGKAGITVRTLLAHQAGLAALDTPLELSDCTDPSRRSVLLEALESQRPAWAPGTSQGYHAITFGMYARELFERVAGEPMGLFLRRELLEPLGSDAYLGTPAHLDRDVATLYPPSTPRRVGRMLGATLLERHSIEARVARATLAPSSVARGAFLNPQNGKEGIVAYNGVAARRAELAWASATSTADGLARAYLPFAQGGQHEGRRYFSADSVTPLTQRGTWSWQDRVLCKPIGWSQGFVKEERHIFSPSPESFGHPGMGGALGWCDPAHGLTFGYVMNKMDWRVRSPRALALCHALYDSAALLGARSFGVRAEGDGGEEAPAARRTSATG